MRSAFGRFGAICILVIAASLIALCAADLTGNWKYKVKTPRGEVQRAFVLKQQGSKLSGHIFSPRGQKEQIKSGKVDGDRVEFTVERRQPGGGSGIVTYKGKVKGDTINGSFVGPGGQTIEWSASRDNLRTR